MKKIWENHKQFINGTAAFFGVMVLIGSLSMFIFPQSTHAQVADFSPFVPFGGFVVSFVPPTVPPAPPCPGYTIIRNADPLSALPLFGVYIPPFSDLLLYDNRILDVPNTAELGGYAPVPFVTCPAPYPVFPIFFNAPFFLDGSGAGPSL